MVSQLLHVSLITAPGQVLAWKSYVCQREELEEGIQKFWKGTEGLKPQFWRGRGRGGGWGGLRAKKASVLKRTFLQCFSYIMFSKLLTKREGGGSCAIIWFGARYYFLFNAVFSVFVLKGPDSNLLSSVESLDYW